MPRSEARLVQRPTQASVHELLDDDLLEDEPAASGGPLEALLEDVGDLECFGTAWQVAGVCAAALARALGARAVLIHSLDPRAHELRIIGAHGAIRDLLGETAEVADDFVAGAVIENARPLTLRFDGELPRIAPKRLGIMGAARSLVAVPVMTARGCIAVIEVVDAEERFAGLVATACQEVAVRMAQFLTMRARAA